MRWLTSAPTDSLRIDVSAEVGRDRPEDHGQPIGRPLDPSPEPGLIVDDDERSGATVRAPGAAGAPRPDRHDASEDGPIPLLRRFDRV